MNQHIDEIRRKFFQKNQKNNAEKFGGNEKVRIFAARLRKNGTKTPRGDRSLTSMRDKQTR